MKAVAYQIPGPIDREDALQDVELETMLPTREALDAAKDRLEQKLSIFDREPRTQTGGDGGGSVHSPQGGHRIGAVNPHNHAGLLLRDAAEPAVAGPLEGGQLRDSKPRLPASRKDLGDGHPEPLLDASVEEVVRHVEAFRNGHRGWTHDLTPTCGASAS